MKLHLSPITWSVLETELGRPVRKRLPSEVRLVLRPRFARDPFDDGIDRRHGRRLRRAEIAREAFEVEPLFGRDVRPPERSEEG